MEVIVAVVIFIVLFLIFRAMVLWYWRINEIADTLGEINKNIAKLAGAPIKTEAQKNSNKNEPGNTAIFDDGKI